MNFKLDYDEELFIYLLKHVNAKQREILKQDYIVCYDFLSKIDIK